MPLFESTLMLLAAAVLLLKLARHLRVPYPSLLALIGGCVAALPFAPHLHIEPRLALALFVAPAVVDTAFEMPPREMLRNWLPLLSLAVILVLLTTAAVAFVGVRFAAIPLAAAVALGAIVAPPDAVAAAAVLREFRLPRRMMSVLQGESLLNDAVALLAFALAVTAAMAPEDPWGPLLPRLLIAVPGGALLGVATGYIAMKVVFPKVAGTLSHILLQFLTTFGTWIAADHLALSPIMAVVALAAVGGQFAPARTSARDRINSNAVWATVVFVLNVLAFLLMGLQARLIIEQQPPEALRRALIFALVVLGVVVAVRFAWVMTYGFVVRRFRTYLERRVLRGKTPSVRVGILVSWCGMRGLVTLATAFALPPQFPQRDLIVLSAFIVVLGTLVLQGFTIRPLIALLNIPADTSLDEEVAQARRAMMDAAVAETQSSSEPVRSAVRAEFLAERDASADRRRPITSYDRTRLAAIEASRQLLFAWRREGRILDDTYHVLEDELDRAELHAAALDSSSLEG
jgi:CPA1 family monovalent cation:H+ antiporter